jgi:hypothetical protein
VADALAGDRAVHEHHLPAVARDHPPAGCGLFHGQLDVLPGSERLCHS